MKLNVWKLGGKLLLFSLLLASVFFSFLVLTKKTESNSPQFLLSESEEPTNTVTSSETVDKTLFWKNKDKKIESPKKKEDKKKPDSNPQYFSIEPIDEAKKAIVNDRYSQIKSFYQTLWEKNPNFYSLNKFKKKGYFFFTPLRKKIYFCLYNFPPDARTTLKPLKFCNFNASLQAEPAVFYYFSENFLFFLENENKDFKIEGDQIIWYPTFLTSFFLGKAANDKKNTIYISDKKRFSDYKNRLESNFKVFGWNQKTLPEEDVVSDQILVERKKVFTNFINEFFWSFVLVNKNLEPKKLDSLIFQEKALSGIDAFFFQKLDYWSKTPTPWAILTFFLGKKTFKTEELHKIYQKIWEENHLDELDFSEKNKARYFVQEEWNEEIIDLLIEEQEEVSTDPSKTSYDLKNLWNFLFYYWFSFQISKETKDSVQFEENIFDFNKWEDKTNLKILLKKILLEEDFSLGSGFATTSPQQIEKIRNFFVSKWDDIGGEQTTALLEFVFFLKARFFVNQTSSEWSKTVLNELEARRQALFLKIEQLIEEEQEINSFLVEIREDIKKTFLLEKENFFDFFQTKIENAFSELTNLTPTTFLTEWAKIFAFLKELKKNAIWRIPVSKRDEPFSFQNQTVLNFAILFEFLETYQKEIEKLEETKFENSLEDYQFVEDENSIHRLLLQQLWSNRESFYQNSYFLLKEKIERLATKFYHFNLFLWIDQNLFKGIALSSHFSNQIFLNHISYTKKTLSIETNDSQKQTFWEKFSDFINERNCSLNLLISLFELEPSQKFVLLLSDLQIIYYKMIPSEKEKDQTKCVLTSKSDSPPSSETDTPETDSPSLSESDDLTTLKRYSSVEYFSTGFLNDFLIWKKLTLNRLNYSQTFYFDAFYNFFLEQQKINSKTTFDIFIQSWLKKTVVEFQNIFLNFIETMQKINAWKIKADFFFEETDSEMINHLQKNLEKNKQFLTLSNSQKSKIELLLFENSSFLRVFLFFIKDFQIKKTKTTRNIIVFLNNKISQYLWKNIFPQFLNYKQVLDKFFDAGFSKIKIASFPEVDLNLVFYLEEKELKETELDFKQIAEIMKILSIKITSFKTELKKTLEKHFRPLWNVVYWFINKVEATKLKNYCLNINKKISAINIPAFNFAVLGSKDCLQNDNLINLNYFLSDKNVTDLSKISNNVIEQLQKIKNGEVQPEVLRKLFFNFVKEKPIKEKRALFTTPAILMLLFINFFLLTFFLLFFTLIERKKKEVKAKNQKLSFVLK